MKALKYIIIIIISLYTGAYLKTLDIKRNIMAKQTFTECHYCIEIYSDDSLYLTDCRTNQTWWLGYSELADFIWGREFD